MRTGVLSGGAIRTAQLPVQRPSTAHVPTLSVDACTGKHDRIECTVARQGLWEPPESDEVLTPDGRVLTYCMYGPRDGFRVVFTADRRARAGRGRHHRGHRAERDPDARARPARLRRLEPAARAQRRRRRRGCACDEDAQGWGRFAVAGSSGGGPHALACAAVLPDPVARCAVSASISPPDVSGPAPSEDEDDPRRNLTSWLAARGEARLRPHIEEAARQIMTSIEAEDPRCCPTPTPLRGPPPTPCGPWTAQRPWRAYEPRSWTATTGGSTTTSPSPTTGASRWAPSASPSASGTAATTRGAASRPPGLPPPSSPRNARSTTAGT